jgi:hypothetical protein
MVLAILAPTPETDINNLNTSRSTLLENPNNVCESSRTCKCIKSFTNSPGGSCEKVCNEILTEYPTPLQSRTIFVGFFSINFPFKWVIISY